MSLDQLSFPSLYAMRSLVAEVLRAESSEPFATATLRISPAYADDVARNTTLFTDPALSARELYDGTLFRALDLTSLSGAARRRSSQWVIIQSPLYGALRPADHVAPYLLSMNSPLPRLAPLAARWRDPLAQVLPAAIGAGLLLDCRAGADTAAWNPRGALGSRWVRIRAGASAEAAKYTQGLLLRHLILDAVDAQSPQDLAEYVGRHFEVRLTRRERGVREWLLDVTAVADDSDRSQTPPTLPHLTIA